MTLKMLTNALRGLPTPEPPPTIRQNVMTQVEGETRARRMEWRVEHRPGVVWTRRVGREPPSAPPASTAEIVGFVQYTRTETKLGCAVCQTTTYTMGERR